DYAEGTAGAEEAVRISETGGQPWSLAVAWTHFGILLTLKEDYQTAIPLLERALDLAQSVDLQQRLATTAGELGHACALAGRVTEGVTLLEQATERPATAANFAHQVVHLAYLAEAYVAADRMRDAQDVAERALDL